MSIGSVFRKLEFCFLICALSTTAAYAQFSVLYTYGSNPGDPVDPQSSTRIAQGRDGNLYSTAPQGGAHGDGAAFMITPSGTLTVLYSFCSKSSCADGTFPYGGLTLGTDGNFYGTTSGGGNTDNAYGDGVVFKMTSAGSLTVLHVFTAATDGNFPYASPVEGPDGNFYGTTSAGGSGSCGTIYKVTPSGTFNVLHTFPNASTDGCAPRSSLVLGTDGNLYGTASYGAYSTFKITPLGKYTHLTSGGVLAGGYAPLMQAPNGSFYGSNGGQIFKMSSSGAFSILHTSSGSTDPNGYGYNGGVVWASDGNLYGDTQTGGTTTNCASNLGYCGVIFKMTAAGAYMDLFNFEDPDGYNGTPLIQHTNGIVYGQANFGGTIPPNAGTFWQWNKGLKPFVSFMPFAGHVGDQIQIFGQGFTNSSVVKFNGVVASHTLTGSTFITATVPKGTLDGYITVTTGGTTLKSLYKFLVHDSWGQGAAMPVAVASPTTGVINGKVYIVGGRNGSTIMANNQIYNISTNSWSTGAVIPVTTYAAASAVVGSTLYVIGGTSDGTTVSNAVWAYNSSTNTWTGKAAILTARVSATAAVKNGIIYVMGGQDSSGNSLTTVESYNPSTNTWTTESPMLVAKSFLSAGLVGTTIDATGGQTAVGVLTGDNEAYNSSTNSWTSLAADPKARGRDCAGSISGKWYIAGGYSGGTAGTAALTLTEVFSPSTNSWTTLAALPQATQSPGSAAYNGLLYCFGGQATQAGAAITNVQIYQP